MSGRKKNRKHRHGQPPNELLDELNSLRDLLGSDEEADIPLLDQVAKPGANKQGARQENQVAAHSTQAPTRPPIAPPQPLQESDLPILFSPLDEEPVEEYAPLLSDADRELLRPLQDLPREEQAPEPKPLADVAEKPIQQEQDPLDEEFQPGLFDTAQKAPQEAPQDAVRKQADKASNPEPEATAEPAADAKTAQPPVKEQPAPAASSQKPLPAALTENPFLPPHIRARLTGGRVPRPPEEAREQVAEPQDAPAPESAVDEDVAVEPAGAEGPTLKVNERERLIEQLMAEQLPELERQLRANITVMVNEIYPEEPESD